MRRKANTQQWSQKIQKFGTAYNNTIAEQKSLALPWGERMMEGEETWLCILCFILGSAMAFWDQLLWEIQWNMRTYLNFPKVGFHQKCSRHLLPNIDHAFWGLSETGRTRSPVFQEAKFIAALQEAGFCCFPDCMRLMYSKCLKQFSKNLTWGGPLIILAVGAWLQQQ